MEKEFIPYELAVKLKELGFDKKCLAFSYIKTEYGFKANELYLTDSFEDLVKNSNEEYYYVRPLWQQAFDWFREKHNLHCVIDEYENPKSWGYLINNDDLDEAFNFNSYKEARLECLKELIKIAEK